MNEHVESDLLKFGLQPTPFDERDFQLGAITTLPNLGDIDPEFLIPLSQKHQGDSDHCSGNMTTYMSEPQEGVELDENLSFAISKEITGDVDAWGQNLRDALKAHVRSTNELRGALPKSLSPFSLENKSSDFLRDLKNWQLSDVQKDAIHKHAKRSFFKITGPYDHFDNARTSMWKFKSPAGTGVNFGWSLSRKVFDTIPQGGFGHAMALRGYTALEDGREVIVLRNSYGKEAGDNGDHYITREVYNHFAEKYGHYMFVDIDKEDAKDLLEKGIKIGDSFLTDFFKRLLFWFFGK